MSRVVLSGYYGFGNAGDEAVLYSIIKSLRREDPLLTPVVLSADPVGTARAYGVEAVNRWHLGAVLQELRRTDLLISGGGSLLQDATGPKSILYYLGICWLAKKLGKPVMFYAQGIGPVRGWLGQSLVRVIGNQVDLITVRDIESSLLLTSLGVRSPAIYVTADPVLGLDREAGDQQAGRHLLTLAGLAPQAARPLAGIAVRDWGGFTQSRVVLAQMADALVGQGWEVIWIPFHYPVDVAACETVAALMREKSYVFNCAATTEQLLGLIGQLRLLIGMRLHALIMAVLVGVPCLGISYDPKIESFLKIVDMPCAGRIGALTLPVLLELIERLTTEPPGGAQSMQDKVCILGDRARDNARFALQLIQLSRRKH